MKRFIIVVLDSFGIGAMDDVPLVRPQDKNANTALNLLKQESEYPIHWETLESLGLMNAMQLEHGSHKYSDKAIFGASKLKHFGADSFFGHQEIAGTNPKKPIFAPISKDLKEIIQALEAKKYDVEVIEKNNLKMLKVNNVICIGDNMETDLGQAINVVGALDDCGMKMIKDVGHTVREVVKQPRVIAFGGSKVSIEDIEAAIITKENKFIGVDAPASGVYDDNYHVEHIGYGVDVSKQLPLALHEKKIDNYFYGKVANIVYNPGGKNFDAVDSDLIFSTMYEDLKKKKEGFYFLNIQETDLAGHAEDSERYIDRVNLSDRWLAKIIEILEDEDILVVMADHGNDPTIGHPRHTRENVPLLIYNKLNTNLKNIGLRDTMADVGQTAAEYFGVELEHGESFLKDVLTK